MDNEAERLASLRSLRLWDLAEAPELDRITQLAGTVFNIPTVLVSLVGQDEQRFLSRFGFAIQRTPRSVSICSVAIGHSEVFEVPDLSTDARFADNPLVASGPLLRYYAGAPLITASGHAIGTLCLIDYRPRRLTDEQKTQLTAFARLVLDQIALRRLVGRRDAVSGLPNRQQFYADLTAMVDQGFAGVRRLVLVDMMALPLAHRVGRALGMGPVEAIIREVALRLETVVRPFAELYQVGVTRFAFMTDSVEGLFGDTLLDQVAQVISVPVTVEGITLRPSCHGGVATFDAATMPDVLRKAMTATQHAIDTNTCWQGYDPVADEKIRRQYRLAADVSDGLAQEQFHLLYQPRVNLRSGEIAGAEALIRWRHPGMGEVSPAEFIPIAMKTAGMRELTDWVLDAVCRQLAVWQAQSVFLPVSVNVAATDFDDGQLLSRVLGACTRHGVAASQVELEITEGEWLASAPAVLEQLAELRSAGIRIAIDDFGVGYSNFSYLYTIPADVLKLDQGLIRGFLTNDRQRAMVRGIIRLCRQIGLEAVAEGIETFEEHDRLVAFGCPIGQGYYYARPLPAEELQRRAMRSGSRRAP